MKLWGGRFNEETDLIMNQFNASIHFDKRLYRADITASIAYAKALHKNNLLTQVEVSELIDGLNLVLTEWEKGEFKIQENDEDIHTANERRLKEIIGPVAGKLHTGRSRNDQVATDMRLWLYNEVKDISSAIRDMIQVIIERAENDIDFIMPGYTHLQRAQPIRWSHLLLSYAFNFQSDLERFTQVNTRINSLPLGCGALAGNPFLIDRQFLAEELGFESVIYNSLVGVCDRDFIVEFLFAASMFLLHMSRLAEDFITYSSSEFHFISVSDAFSTGSSLMPQKKNPDSLELLRGKSGRVFGHLSGLMMTIKALPSTYNKDLQEDKEPMFDTVDTIKGCIHIASSVIKQLNVYPESMMKCLNSEMLATDVADYLVRRGVPFRETHHIVGLAVAHAERTHQNLHQLPLEFFKELHPAFDNVIQSLWDYEKSVENRDSLGGTSKNQILLQISKLRELLNKH